MEPLFKTSYLGLWIKVYPNRIDFKTGAGSQSIPIAQIASIQLGSWGIMNVIVETTGGKKYKIPTKNKNEVKDAIYKAQDMFNNSEGTNLNSSDELAKSVNSNEKRSVSEQLHEDHKTSNTEKFASNKQEWYEKWWVIILLFPFFVLFWVSRLIWRQKWEKNYRIAAIAALWIVFFLYGASLSQNKTNKQHQVNKSIHEDWHCIGPDGKRIGLDQQSCDEFINAWKNGKVKQADLATFDVPSLVGKDLDGVIAVLGQPKGIDPTALQIQQGVTEWDKTFVKDGKELLVTYTISDRKIVDFFISTSDPSGATSDKEALLKQENLKQDDAKYRVEFVKAIKDPSTFTGVKVIPNQ
ncbi:MAG TPA: hypothetical protein VLG12_02520 [Candidatus Saccharimonadales bacterium]|nr:hypothetical protein [Candidatus Saccharimonadales bacterium]